MLSCREGTGAGEKEFPGGRCPREWTPAPNVLHRHDVTARHTVTIANAWRATVVGTSDSEMTASCGNTRSVSFRNIRRRLGEHRSRCVMLLITVPSRRPGA